MAIQTEPTRIQIPFADSGTKNVIPDTNSTPSASQAASWTDGFPAQCSLPLSAGGIPPARADFNGLFNTMTQSLRYGQEGGVWAWDATVDYGTNRLVLGSDGLLYWSVAQSGPNVGGAQDPTTDDGTYWGSITTKTPASGDNSNNVATTSWINGRLSDFLFGVSDIYIDGANGSDDNNGFTQQTPIKTGVKFHSILSKIIFTGEPVAVHVKPYDYSSDTGMFVFVNSPRMHIIFESGAVIDSLFVGAGGSVNITGSVNLKYRIAAASGGTIVFGYGAGSSISISFTDVNKESLIRADNGGVVDRYWDAIVSITCTNCKVSTGTFCATGSGIISRGGGDSPYTVTGSVTGQRYAAIELGGIFGFGSATAIPGTSNGSTASGGQYT